MFKLTQYDNKDKGLQLDKIDLFIGASGFETRSIFQFEEFKDLIQSGIIIGFNRFKDLDVRKFNDSKFEKSGLTILQVNEEDKVKISLSSISKKISDLLNSVENPNIFLDYSSMTRNWYSYILYVIFNIDKRNKINLFLGYSHAEYVENSELETSNRIVNPLFGYCNFGIPNKPTALVIGLGNEANKVFGLKEYFDAVPFIFHTDKSYNLAYYNDSKVILDEVLNQVAEKNVYEYPINDLIYSYFMLENLCTSLLQDNRVVLAPCGPKPFALLSMLLSLKFDHSLEVWRISAGKDIQPIDKKPTGLVTILNLKFIEQSL
jgi:hypothetical protein